MTSSVEQAQRILQRAGLRGSILVRDLGSGQQVALNPGHPFPLISLVKVPLAATILSEAAAGAVDLRAQITIDDANRSPGGPGLARFLHPASVSVRDLITLSIEVSDNSAADAIFELVSPEQVTRWLQGHGIRDVIVRHPVSDLYHSLARHVNREDEATVAALVVAAHAAGHPSPLPQLDLDQANTGTATGVADLLALLWGEELPDEVAQPVRYAMNGNLLRHRLTPDFVSETSKWSSKTGTFIHLRHEAGVVEHRNGATLAVVALTASDFPAREQPLAEQAIGRAARLLHDDLTW